MPAGDVTLTAISSKVANNVKYTVEYYYQVNGNYSDTTDLKLEKTAKTGTQVGVDDIDKTPTKPEYVLDASKTSEYTGTVAGDGSLVLKVYFKQEFSVTYKPGTQGTFNIQTTEHLAYNADTPAFIGEKTHKDGYEFTSWDKTVENKVTNTVEYVAEWRAITYEIEYELNGGSLAEGVTNKETYTVETENFTLNNPQRAGYTFKGWTGTDLEEKTANVSIAKGSTGDRQYEANWEAIEYTITYDLDGGNLLEGKTNPETYTVETDGFTLNNPVKSGYTFLGWTGTDLAEKTVSVSIAQGSIGNRSYKANWSANSGTKYHVRHYLEKLDSTDSSNKNNYSLSDDFELSGTTNAPVTAEPIEHVGFTFDSTNANNVLNGNIDGNGDLVLELYYKRNSYALTLEKDENVDSVTGAGTYKFEAPVQIDATLKTQAGYTIEFVKWQSSTANSEGADKLTDKLDKSTNFVMPAGDVTLTAISSKTADTVNYTVEKYYETEGAYPTETSNENKEIRQALTGTTVNVTEEDKVTNKPTYVFDNTKNGYLSGTVAGDGSLVLKVYFKQEFSVTYKPGTQGTFNIQTTEHLAYNADTPAFIGEKTHKDGYEFTSWDKTVENKVTNTVEYVAEWRAITYEIEYELNGGSLAEGVTNKETYTVETENFTLNNPQRAGYTFKGWTGTDLEEKTANVSIAKGSTGDRQYEANWEAIEYTITYDLDGGNLLEGKTNPETYTVETDGFTLNNPVKSGYTFLGWTGTDLAEKTVSVSIAQGSIGNRSYKANWSANSGTKYHVRHYLEKLDSTDSSNKNNYSLSDDFELSGTTNAPVTAEPIEHVGFTFDSTNANNVLNGNIDGNGDLVLELYYKRNSYALTLEKDENVDSVTGAGTYKFEAPVQIDATLKTQAGYTIEFVKWQSSTANSEGADKLTDKLDKSTNFVMPAGNVTLTAITNITALDASYTVAYYYQADGMYPALPNSTVVRQGKTGTQASITNADKEPITADYVYDTDASNIESTDENGIKADGSTTLKVYFKQQFIVTFKPGEHGTFEDTVIRNNDYNAELPEFTGLLKGTDGYEFDGWKLTKIGDSEVNDQTEIPTVVKANMEYTAQWKTMPKPLIIHTPTTWTNQNVNVTVISPEGYESYGKEHRIGDGMQWHTYSEPFEVEQNCTVYARLTVNSNNGEATSHEITNIDKIKPTFTSVPTYTIENDVATVVANVTDNLSGIVEYGFKGESYSTYTTYTCSSTPEVQLSFGDIHDSGTYVIYAKDAAGNISETSIEVLMPVHNVAKIVSAPDGYESLVGTEYESLALALSTSDVAATAGNVKIEILSHIDNEGCTIASGRDYTINLNNYCIKNQEANPVFLVNGKLNVVDENNVGTGTVVSLYGIGIQIALNGQLTLGTDRDGLPSIFSPIVEGLTYGIKKDIDYEAEQVYDEKDKKYYFPEGVFNFYDGKVIGGTAAYSLQRVNDTPTMYDPTVSINGSTNNQEAVLATVLGVEATIGKKTYLLLESAIAEANNVIGTSDEQVEITIVKDIVKDADHKIIVDETKNIKLDLNGHTFTTTEQDYVIKNYGKLEIYDSSEALDKNIIKTIAGESQFSADKTTWNDYQNRNYNITLNTGTGTLDEDGALVLNGSTNYKINNWDRGSYASYEVYVAIDQNFTPRNSQKWYECSCVLGCELNNVQKDMGIIISSDGYFAFGYDDSGMWKSDVRANDGNYHKLRLDYTPNNIVFYIDDVQKANVDYVAIGDDISYIGVGWNAKSANTNIKGKIKSVRIDKLTSSTAGVITGSTANTIYNGISENVTSNLEYQNIDLSLVEPNDENYYFQARGSGNPGLISNNSGVAGTARSYIELDLSDKKGMYEIAVDTTISSPTASYGYITVSNQKAIVNHNDSYGRKVYVSGNKNTVDGEYKFNIAGGEKYYIHFGYYKNTASGGITNDCFIIKSMKIAKITKAGSLKLSAGTFENTKLGTSSSYTSVVDNDSLLEINGAKIIATQDFSTAVKNGKNIEAGYLEFNSGEAISKRSTIENNHNGVANINGGNISASLNNYGTAIDNSGYLYLKGTNTTVSGKENGIRNVNRGYAYINNGIISGKYAVANGSTYNNFESVVINGGNYSASQSAIYNSKYSSDSKGIIKINNAVIDYSRYYGIENYNSGTIEINNVDMSCTYPTGESTIKYYGLYNSGNGKVIYNGGNVYSERSAVYNYKYGTVDINGGTISSRLSAHPTVNNVSGDGALVTINVTGGTILSSGKAIENNGNGIINITGGNIETTGNYTCVDNANKGSITIGSKDGNVNCELPSIKSPTTALGNGVGKVYFYDGVLIGQENITVSGSFAEIEENNYLLKETKVDNLQYITLGKPTNYVAKISQTYNPNVSLLSSDCYKFENNYYYFTTLNYAIDACSTANATTIDLVDDVYLSNKIVVNANQDISIEFNGKTMYPYMIINFENNGKLKFKNDNKAESQYGNIKQSAGKLILNNNNAEASISDIAISYESSQGNNNVTTSDYRFIIDNYGKMDILSSIYYIHHQGNNAMFAHGIVNEENGCMNIDNLALSGNVNYPIENKGADGEGGTYAVIIKNSNIATASGYGVCNSGTGTVLIEDSTVTSNNDNENSSSGKIIVNNSTISKRIYNKGSGYVLVKGANSNISNSYNGKDATMEIQAGVTKGVDNYGTLIISGGEISYTGSDNGTAVYNRSGSSAQISGVGTTIISTRRGIINEGTMSIVEASIKGNGTNGIENNGTLTLGNKDGIVEYAPNVYGKQIGIKNTGTCYFYDGIIDGLETSSITGVIPSETEDGCLRVIYKGTEMANFDDGTQEQYSIASGREISVLQKVNVAHVVSKNKDYTSLGEAFNQAESTDTIKLIHDASVSGTAESAEIVAGKNITLDFNGYNIVAGNAETIVNNGTLTIVDSTSHIDQASGEIVEGRFLSGASTIIKNNGNCTIQNGTYGLTLGGTNNEYYDLIKNAGTFTINGGKYYTEAGYSNLINAQSGSVTVNAGSFEVKGRYSTAISCSLATVIINDATIKTNYSDSYALYLNDNGLVELVNGTVISANAATNKSNDGTISIKGGTVSGQVKNYYDGTINVSGGTINNTSGAGILNGDSTSVDKSGTINITGGNIEGKDTGVKNNQKNGTINIDGTSLSAQSPIVIVGNKGDSSSYGIANLNTGVVNIKGHVQITAKNTTSYGVYNVSSGIVNIGDSTNVTNNVKITATNYGVYNLSKTDNEVNYYGGTITANQAVYGYINNIPNNYEIIRMVDENENEVYEIGHTVDVASVSGVKYSTLNEAMQNCTNGTVVLLKDVVLPKSRSITVSNNQNIILDINNNMIKLHNIGTSIENNGVLKIKDSSVEGEGTICGSAGNAIKCKNTFEMVSGKISLDQMPGDKVIYVTENGKVKISGGEFEAIAKQTGNIGNSSSYIVYSDNSEEITVTGGLFKLSGNSGIHGAETYQYAIYTTQANAKVSISDATFENTGMVNYGTKYSVHMNNGGTTDIFGDSYISNDYGVYAKGSAVITVYGNANLECSNYGIYANAESLPNVETTINVNGGAVKGIYTYNYSSNSNTKCTVNVRGGEITGAVGIESNNEIYNNIVNVESGKINATGKGIAKIKTINVSGGEIIGANCGIEVGNNGVVNITGGKVRSTSGAGVLVSKGTLTLGEDEGDYPSQTSPEIEGSTYGVQNVAGTVNYYDGILKGNIYATDGTVNSVPEMFSVVYSNGGTVALLGIESTFEQVAKVNGSYYSDIASAVDAAVRVNGKVEVCNNITTSKNFEIPVGSSVTIDLRGFTINAYTQTEEFIINNGTLTIEDSLDDGTSTSAIINHTGKAITNNGTLTIGTDDGIQHINAPILNGTTVAVENNGTMNIYDGKLEN